MDISESLRSLILVNDELNKILTDVAEM